MRPKAGTALISHAPRPCRAPLSPFRPRRCVLYEMTALRHAFDGSNMRQLAMKICAQDPRPISSRCAEATWAATSAWAMLRSVFSVCLSPFRRGWLSFVRYIEAACGVRDGFGVPYWECFEWPLAPQAGFRYTVVAEYRRRHAPSASHAVRAPFVTCLQSKPLQGGVFMPIPALDLENSLTRLPRGFGVLSVWPKVSTNHESHGRTQV